MANYKISGVWISNGTITHYAMHTINPNNISQAVKTLKSEAVRILSDPSNEAVTWLWNYQTSYWQNGAKVIVVNGSFLRTTQDGTVRDNLSHLIDYDWL